MKGYLYDVKLPMKGIGLRLRFTLAMSLALTLVMSIAAVSLYRRVTRVADEVMDRTIGEAVLLSHSPPEPFSHAEFGDVRTETQVGVYPMTYGTEQKEGLLYCYPSRQPDDPKKGFRLLVPGRIEFGKYIQGMIITIAVVVVVVGAGVALLTAVQVTRPIHRIIQDVRQIAKGDLQHRTKTGGSGEVELLARAIDSMASGLKEGEGVRVELSVRERELDLAAGVREALLPTATPLVEGYDLAAAFLSSPRFGGDFHDFIELPDGLVGLLVCDVSGRGVPAALVGATARSTLRGELARTSDVTEALRRVNRWLSDDVRRGMFVTALYALIDPAAGRATVACAGHRIPLLRYVAAEGSLRVVHPDGIALGFDRGPVFERRLQVVETPIERGDRLLLANSAPVRLQNPEKKELGEKAFYSRVLKHATLDGPQFLKALRRDLEQFAGEGGIQDDVALVTISRVS